MCVFLSLEPMMDRGSVGFFFVLLYFLSCQLVSFRFILFMREGLRTSRIVWSWAHHGDQSVNTASSPAYMWLSFSLLFV